MFERTHDMIHTITYVRDKHTYVPFSVYEFLIVGFVHNKQIDTYNLIII